jgi:hypothetical protein
LAARLESGPGGNYAWNAGHQPAGIYLAAVKYGGKTVTRKLALVR